MCLIKFKSKNMKVKQKPCKGTGKAKGHGCGEIKFAHRYGLCTQCFAKWLYNTPDGLKMLSDAAIKASSDRISLEKAFKEKKERVGLTTILDSVEQICHKYIRLRDEGKPCAACGAPYSSDFQASHCYKAELYSSLRFNEFNIHGGCIGCNIYKDGNIDVYKVRLPMIIGEAKAEELRLLASRDQNNFKWDREELKRIKEYYKLKIKQL